MICINNNIENIKLTVPCCRIFLNSARNGRSPPCLAGLCCPDLGGAAARVPGCPNAPDKLNANGGGAGCEVGPLVEVWTPLAWLVVAVLPELLALELGGAGPPL